MSRPDLRICPFLGIIREEGFPSPVVCRKEGCRLFYLSTLECSLADISSIAIELYEVRRLLRKGNKDLIAELKNLRASLPS